MSKPRARPMLRAIQDHLCKLFGGPEAPKIRGKELVACISRRWQEIHTWGVGSGRPEAMRRGFKIILLVASGLAALSVRTWLRVWDWESAGAFNKEHVVCVMSVRQPLHPRRCSASEELEDTGWEVKKQGAFTGFNDHNDLF